MNNSSLIIRKNIKLKNKSKLAYLLLIKLIIQKIKKLRALNKKKNHSIIN